MRALMTMGMLLALASGAAAQGTATPTSRLAWDQIAGSLAEASGYAYEGVYDGNPAPVVMTGVTCAGAASPYQCAGSFPALTPGPHTVAVQARNAAGPSPLSAVFNFAFVALPSAPQNLRIVSSGL